MTKQLLWTKKS